MKFTKEEAYKELVGRMTEKGEKLNLSERTLNRQLETLIKYVANDEMDLSSFIDAVLPDVKELDGQYRKDNSDFIKKWSEDHPTNNPKDDKKDNKKDDVKEKEENPELAAILSQLNALQERIAKDDKEKVISDKRKDLVAAMEKKGIKDKNWTNDFLAEITITEDMDVDAKADSFLKIYNKSKASESDDFTPYSSGGHTDKISNMFDDIKKDYEKEHKKKEDLM